MKEHNVMMIEGAPRPDGPSSDSEDDTSVGPSPSGTGSQDDVNREQTEAIAKRETKVLFGMRLIVLAVLIGSTCILAYFVHEYLKTEEEDEFHETFESDARKVLQAVGTSLDLTLGSVDALTVSMVSYAKSTNQSWPFVTVPDFSIRAMKTLRLSKAVNIGAYYIVNHDQREAWENYTMDHHAWVNESIALQDADDIYQGPIIYDFHVTKAISDGWELPVPEADLYMPFWQSAPVVPIYAPFNFNGLTWTQAAPSFEQIMIKHKVILGNAWLLPDPDNEEEMAEHEVTLGWVKNFVPPGQNPDEPVSDFYYPILDATDSITIKDPMEKDLVAVFSLTIYWRQMIEKILPPQSRGLIVVFSSPCNPTFTYQINGPNVEYLGRGDLHDDKYDDMEIAANLIEIAGFSNEDSFYSGLPIDEEWCPFTVRLYPSKVQEDDYITNDPVVFSIVVAGIFLFTSLIFICYDCMVELRQRRVMNRATESSALVASLFPKAVRDRLYEEAKEKREEEQKRKKHSTFLQSGAGNRDLAAMMESGDLAQNSHDSKSRPIADLFQNTTIFFADLVGFTKWSASRSPEEVFMLLETIYGSFDAIAEKRHVFKVETIGDSYVAATGLPKAQEDHAIIMVRFARDCLRAIPTVCNELAIRLGADTRDIQMRVGLHTGPTTAGVLRGIKGRFQLFGDTVNMASRMESTGIPGRIQVSEAMAEELSRKNKAHWLIPNDQLVNVKGKGDVKTYFVTIATGKTVHTSTDSSPTQALAKNRTTTLHSISDSDAESDNDSVGDQEDFEELRLEDKLHEYFQKNEKSGGL